MDTLVVVVSVVCVLALVALPTWVVYDSVRVLEDIREIRGKRDGN